MDALVILLQHHLPQLLVLLLQTLQHALVLHLRCGELQLTFSNGFKGHTVDLTRVYGVSLSGLRWEPHLRAENLFLKLVDFLFI